MFILFQTLQSYIVFREIISQSINSNMQNFIMAFVNVVTYICIWQTFYSLRCINRNNLIGQFPMDLLKQQVIQLMSQQKVKRTEQEEGTYRESSYRFVNFAIYILAALVNSLPAQTFSSINSLVRDRFQYDQILVTLNTLFFPILHPIFAFPANWILDKFGMKIGCCIGGALLIAGVWMRTLLEVGNIFWCLFGSVLAAIGNVFILNSPSILANNWFKPASIPGIISFAVLANLISVTLGGGLPGLILDAKTSTSQDIQSFLRVQAIIISVPLVIMFLGLRSRPQVPPSKSAQSQHQNKMPYKETLQKLAKNTQYLKIMLIMTLSYGTLTSYLANLEQCIKALGFGGSTKMTSEIVLSAMAAGIVSSFFFVKKIKTTLQYKSVMALCMFGAFIMFLILQIILLRDPPDWACVAIGAMTGIFMIPTTSLFMAYSSQVVFPLGQGSATGYLFAAAQTFGFVAGMGSAALIKSEQTDDQTQNSKWQLYLFMGLHVLFFLISSLLILSTKNKLNRTKYLGARKQGEKETEQGFIFSST